MSVSEEEIRVAYGNANFGNMSPRSVVNDGVLKYSMGFTGGSTQIAILRTLGLITKPKRYQADLTKKGKEYLREQLSRSFCEVLDLMKNPE